MPTYSTRRKPLKRTYADARPASRHATLDLASLKMADGDKIYVWRTVNFKGDWVEYKEGDLVPLPSPSGEFRLNQ